MRRCLMALLVVGLISINTRDAAAQPSSSDVAAAVALLNTPVGALTPIMVSAGMKGEKPFNSVAARYSRYSETGFDANALGGSFYRKLGVNALVSGTLGYSKASDCTGCDAIIMLGGDVHSTLWDNSASKSTTATSINLQGSLGWATTDGGSFLSAAVGVPLAVSMEQSNKSRIGAFVAPAFGWGRMSPDGFDAESGTRPILGAGASWMAAAGWGLHASFSKVFIEDGGNSIGIGFSWKLGAAAQ